MSDEFPARGPTMEWEGITSVSKGSYRLHTGYGADFAEPLCIRATGLLPTPLYKRDVKSYDAGEGTVETFGVSLNIKLAIDAYTAEDFALKGRHVAKREIAALLIGAIKAKNLGEEIEINRTIIPADGGFKKMSSALQFSLGKTLQKIKASGYGYIWVNPDYEKPRI
ncbi:hypothetical protein LCGC14_1127290 [marine sediment metagenome]|uniref:Uncharacterized protein n=1 Tax=marine sediment metagenome TaxID=412755 RepID=A0A0F9MQ06_9ZZZZ